MPVTLSTRIFRPLMYVVLVVVPDMPSPLPVLVCFSVTSASAGAHRANASIPAAIFRVMAILP